MQLVSYGAQDIYISGNPQITFWKVLYKRHTNFAVESIEVTFNGQADFNKRVTAIINRSMSPDERERLTDTLRRIERLPMVIDDSPTVTARGVISRVQRAEARGHVDLVIVDYLQLLQATDTRKPRAEQVADMTRELREMARSVGCSLLVLAQLNREVEKRMGGEPLLSDLRESGAIEQDADTVTFAVDATGGLREEQWEQRHPTKRYPESLVRLLVRKNRNGPPGEATLFFRRPHTWFYSIGDE